MRFAARQHVEGAAVDVDLGLAQRAIADLLDRGAVGIAGHADLVLDPLGLHVRSARDRHVGFPQREVLAAGRAAILREWKVVLGVH